MEICIVLLILLIVLYVVVNYGKKQPQKAALLQRHGCQLPGEVVLPGQLITWTTGMQWNIHWTLNPAEFAFTATYGQGLFVGLGSAMTDTGGGYVVQLRAPSGNELLYGVSDMGYGGKVHCLARVPRVMEFRPRRYRVRCVVGRITLWEDGVLIFDSPLASLFNNPRSIQTNLKFFGFGSSAEDSADRTITQIESIQ